MSNLSPLDRLERDVLDDSVPLASLLRQVMVIGGRSSSTPLRRWVQLELNSYDSAPDDVPDYRRFAAQIMISGMWGYRQATLPISPMAIPEPARGSMTEEVTLTWAVGEIEAQVAGADPTGIIKLSKRSSDLATLLTMDQQRQQNNPYIQIYEVYWAVSPASLQGVLDRIRTRLTEFVTELRATMPPGESEPTAEQVAQVVQHVWVTAGDNSPVNITAPFAQANGGNANAAQIQGGTPAGPPSPGRPRLPWKR